MKNLLKNLIKIFIIAIIFLGIYYFFTNYVFNENQKQENSKKINQNNYKNFYSSDISKTWVAITTNLWMKHKKNNSQKNISPTIYKDLFSFEELKKDKQNAKKIIIFENMNFSKEYFSLLRSDFKTIIEKSENRKKTLENILFQLKIRFDSTNENIKNLEKQRDILAKEMEKINSEVEEEKQKISFNYKKIDFENLSENIDKYLELKNDFIYVRTYIVFINNFLNTYKNLNNYNKTLANALYVNKDAIEKGSYVVLPNNWKEILKDYGLLYTEEEYLNLKKKEEQKN